MPDFSTRSICRVSWVTVSGSGAFAPARSAVGLRPRARAADGRRRATCAWKSKKLLEDIRREYNAASAVRCGSGPESRTGPR